MVTALLALILTTTEPLAVLPTRLEGASSGLTPHVLDEHILAAIEAHSGYDALGAADLDTLLEVERRADLADCDDVVCLSRLGGALGTKRVLAVTVAALSDGWALSGKLVDVEAAAVERRTSSFVDGGERAVLVALAGVVDRLLVPGAAAAAPVSPALVGPRQPSPTFAVADVDFLFPDDRRAYQRAVADGSSMSVREWVEMRNEESTGVAVAEGLMAAFLLAGPLVADSEELAALYALNVVALSTTLVVDFLDVGEVQLQLPVESMSRGRAPSQVFVAWSQGL